MMHAPEFAQHHAGAGHCEVQPHRIKGDEAKHISGDSKCRADHAYIVTGTTLPFNQNRHAVTCARIGEMTRMVPMR